MPPSPTLLFIDEHRQPADAPAAAVWTALVRTVGRRSRAGAWGARLLGCSPREGTALFTGERGQAVPGFRVAEAEAGRRLVLQGRHRFAAYAVTFVIEGGTLSAQTHAAFPGLLGTAYRAAVIGSGGHSLITKALLKLVARRAARES